MLGLALTAVAISANSAGASSMTYTAQEIVFDGLGGSSPTVTLPDLVNGGTVELGTFAYDNPQVGTFPTPVQWVGGLFGFLMEPAGGSGPWLSVTGQFQGSIDGPSGSPARWSGSFTGVASQVSPLSNGLPIPEPLLDLVDRPSRLHISTTVGVSAGGHQSFVNVFLTIDPATVPEPSTLVVMLVTLAGVIVGRKWCRAA